MSAAYTKLVQGLITEERYEEALEVAAVVIRCVACRCEAYLWLRDLPDEVCDEHLPVDSELTDKPLSPKVCSGVVINYFHGSRALGLAPQLLSTIELDTESADGLGVADSTAPAAGAQLTKRSGGSRPDRSPLGPREHITKEKNGLAVAAAL
eukprot:1865452-Amphidinium_carterae.1